MKKQKFWISLALSAVIYIVIFICGVFFGSVVKPDKNHMAICYLVLLGLIVVICVADQILSNVFLKKLNRASIEQKQEMLLARRDEALKDLSAVARRTRRSAYLVVMYICFVSLLALLFVFTAGAASYNTALLGFALIYVVIYKTLGTYEKADFSKYSTPSDYPIIYELAEKAQKTMGQKGKIHIYISPDCDMAIAKIGKEYSLLIGAILLNILTREELYQGFIHEFAHCSEKCHPSNKENAIMNFLSSIGGNFDPWFKYISRKFAYEYTIFKVTSSVCVESLADNAVTEYGDPHIASGILIKTACFGFFYRELDRYMDDCFYEAENLRDDVTARILERFKELLPEKKAFWRKLLENEIQPRNASHPILRSRLEGIGVSLSDCDIILPEDNSSAFSAECQKALLDADKKRYDAGKDSYSAEREQYYLEPMRRIERWESDGRPLQSDRVRDILDAMTAIGKYTEAEALCDRMIETVDNEYERAHAYFIKGKMLLQRYDKDGMELLYKAVDMNCNYVDEGIELIGSFCCVMGLSKELEVYREKAVYYHQKMLDNEVTDESIIKGINICNWEMPKKVFDENLDFIIKTGGEKIFRLFLVGRSTPEGCKNVYIVDFDKDCSAEDAEDIMYAVFCYLDTRPDDLHYCLFYFDDAMGKTLVKHKDSCIYEK